jgi:hypothetical protein
MFDVDFENQLIYNSSPNSGATGCRNREPEEFVVGVVGPMMKLLRNSDDVPALAKTSITLINHG